MASNTSLQKTLPPKHISILMHWRSNFTIAKIGEIIGMYRNRELNKNMVCIYTQ